MGGKGSGGDRGKLHETAKSKSQSPSSLINEELNTRIMGFINELRHLPKISLEDYDAVDNRITEYLALCGKYNLKIQVNGLSAALGISRNDLYDMVTLGYKTIKGMTIYPEVREMIGDTYRLMATYAEASLNETTGNPAGQIFLMKNHYDYRDQKEQTILKVDMTPQLEPGEKVAEKYAKLVGAEAEIISIEEPKRLSGPKD